MGLHKLREQLVRELELPVLEPALQGLPSVSGLLSLVRIQLLLDFRAGLRSAHPRKPVAARPLVLAGNDFHHVSRLELLLYLHRLPVHLASRAAAAYVGVYVECEIQHRSPCGEYSQLAARSEHENVLHRRSGKVFRLGAQRVLERLPDRLEPVLGGRFVAYALVGPVGCASVLGFHIHPLGADLYFESAPLLVLDRDVQGLVAVGTGSRKPVAKPLGVRLILLSHKRIHLPAQVLLHYRVVLAVDDETYREHIENPFEAHLLGLHLAVDRIGALGAYLQFVLDARFRELLLQRPYELQGELLAVLLGSLELVCDSPELLRIGVLEADVAHLVIDVVQSQLMGQRHIEHHSLEQLLLPGTLGKDGERAHHFQPVGNFQHYGPGVG